MLGASPLTLIRLDYVDAPSAVNRARGSQPAHSPASPCPDVRWRAIRNKCLMAATAFVALASLGLAWHRAQSPDPRTSPGFDLAADRSGPMWAFRWNPRAPGFAGARSIHVEIADGVKRSTYPLTLEQVAAGSVLYLPVTPDVVFAIRATDAQGRMSRELLFLTGGQPNRRPVHRSRPPA